MRLVQARCAGLLEIAVQPKPIRPNITRQHPSFKFSTVIPFGDGSQTIRFIHRTVFDFLTDTAEGGTILSTDATSEQSLYMKLFRGGLSTRYLLQDLQSARLTCLEMYTGELSDIWHMAGPCKNSALDAQSQSIATLLELSGSSGSLMLEWNRSISPILRKEEFLVYAACFRLSKYVIAALVKRETCDQLKSDILLAISALFARSLSVLQGDIALVGELLRRGADPNYKGCVLMFEEHYDWRIASPFCEFLAGILTVDLHSATKLSIQRACHIIDGFLRHGANTSDLVNVNLCILDSREVQFVSGIEISCFLDEEEVGEEEETFMFCSLLIPAFILIDALVFRLEEALCKTGHSQEKCCDLDRVVAICAKAKLIDAAAKPRIIVLFAANMCYRAVFDEDSVYLSDAVVNFLTNPRPQDAIAMLIDRYLEVYWRSERRFDLKALLEGEGLIWDFDAHGHGLDEECTCTL